MSEHFEPAAGCRCASCMERRGYMEQTEIWQARATQAEARVAELEREIKALTDDRGKLMGILAAQTGETMRLRGACEAAAAMLRDDRPRSALKLLDPAHA